MYGCMCMCARRHVGGHVATAERQCSARRRSPCGAEWTVLSTLPRRRSGIVSTWCTPPRTTRHGSSMSRPETRHDFDPYDGEPGKAWDDFDERLLNFTSGKTDDRGCGIE